MSLSNNERVVKDLSDRGTWEQHFWRWNWAKSKIKEGGNLLVAACGYGYEIPIYQEGKPSEILAVDKAEPIKYASKEFKGQAKFLTEDLETCKKLSKYTDQFDLIVSFETIEHLLHPEIYLETAKNALKVGGFFIGSVPLNVTADPVVYTEEGQVRELLTKYLGANVTFGLQLDTFVLFEYTKETQ